MTHKPGAVRDAIFGYLKSTSGGALLADIHEAVEKKIGKVAPSSVRSYLNENTPDHFERVARGHYRLRASETAKAR